MLDAVIDYVGHKVHIVRSREVRTLLDWCGDLSGKWLLDVAGGDGYWATQAQRRGAKAVCLDIARQKLLRGQRMPQPPGLIEGDALRLPFRDGAFDIVMSVCAIEHFDNGPAALAEMARVLAPGGRLVLSADTLSRRQRWPHLFDEHARRYHVQRTYTHDELKGLLSDVGLHLEEHTYLFRTALGEHLYLGLSARGGKVGWNAAAPLAPLVALADRGAPNTEGSVVCLTASRSD